MSRTHRICRSIVLDTKYGRFYQLALHGPGKVTVTRSFLLRRGSWPAAEYPDFKAFMETVDKACSSQIVLKKE